jgi:hypothetical protein
MGYTTWFSGQIDIQDGKALTAPQKLYLERFAEIRHMARDHSALVAVPDPIRENVPLNIGVEGEYFVYSDGIVADSHEWGKDEKLGVLDGNRPPRTQPGLWCHWIPTANGKAIEWDEAEKFYDFHTWLEYIIINFMKPWGYTLEGEIKWDGEDSEDRGTIYVKDNMVDSVDDEIISPRPYWERATTSPSRLGPLPKGMEHPTPKADYSLKSDDIDWPEFGRLVGDV